MTDPTLTLPDLPPLREEAERRARETHEASPGDYPWDSLRADVQTRMVLAQRRLLRDLRRPETRDWMARDLARMLGLKVGCTAPDVELDESGLRIGSYTVWSGSLCEDDGPSDRNCPPLRRLSPDDGRRISDWSSHDHVFLRDGGWPRAGRNDRPRPVESVAQCYVCGAPATCYGHYEEGETPVDWACDTCCGHGNEDGWCLPAPSGPRLVDAAALAVVWLWVWAYEDKGLTADEYYSRKGAANAAEALAQACGEVADDE